MDELRFTFQTNPASMRHEMWIMQGRSVADPLTMREYKPGDLITPTISIPFSNEGWLQSLAEALWRNGFRPKDAEIKDGERLAMKENLTDLRKMLEIE